MFDGFSYQADELPYGLPREEDNAKKPAVQTAENHRAYLFIKRFFDITLSALGLVLLSPVFLVLAIWVKADSKGPAFFAHTRVGIDHKPINIYKFRTMVDHAEDMIQNFTPEQQKEYQQNFKVEDDPRITRVGRFLRKTSLDELPQLLNILRGDISIVGPRPVVVNELEKYGDHVQQFLSVRPGLTGYWQVHGRSNTSYEERVKMDVYYISHRSLLLDLKIVCQTIPAVLTKSGAM